MVHSHELLATVHVYLTASHNRDSIRNVLIPQNVQVGRGSSEQAFRTMRLSGQR